MAKEEATLVADVERDSDADLDVLVVLVADEDDRLFFSLRRIGLPDGSERLEGEEEEASGGDWDLSEALLLPSGVAWSLGARIRFV